MVEAAGVELRVSIDNRQLIDSRFATKSANAMFSKSTVQTLYKNLKELHKRHRPHLSIRAQKRSTLSSVLLDFILVRERPENLCETRPIPVTGDGRAGQCARGYAYWYTPACGGSPDEQS
jgi:hypothetical protein